MFLDTALARRIERGESLNAAGCGESIAVAGGFAAFSGVGSPLTRAVGLGLNGPVSAADLDFCPLADPTMLKLLGDRSYRIVECNNALAGPAAGSPDARVRTIHPGEEELWTRVMLEGFFERAEFSAVELDTGRRLLRLEGASAWLALVDGAPAAAAAMNTRGKLALLFADSTVRRFRNRGLHLALIRARLAHAARLGCDLATASTAPGSASQRNYERAGLRVVYTKLNMQKD